MTSNHKLISSLAAFIFFLALLRLSTPLHPKVMLSCSIFAFIMVLVDFLKLISDAPINPEKYVGIQKLIQKVSYEARDYILMASFPLTAVITLSVDGNVQMIADITTLFALSATLFVISIRE
ncbi:hypothetical protein [Bacillus sp. PK3_68]|uniref:hypothetical protein n=1 Tax=Bacillus sp. PK3_68 TaxID=2027408 RepID=UPI000E734C53|nr:hypothetical protein [Bacillus sp. PK3_68]RJS60134.1 hypothetical protein CJ483_08710 [Bacillus sp. PK3_68]